MTHTTTDHDLVEFIAKLRRAHRMSCSDPNDSARHTMYGDAADALDSLRRTQQRQAWQGDKNAIVTTYGVVLDDIGSTDVYDTEDEARRHYAPGCRILRIETLDTDITEEPRP